MLLSLSNFTYVKICLICPLLQLYVQLQMKELFYPRKGKEKSVMWYHFSFKQIENRKPSTENILDMQSWSSLRLYFLTECSTRKKKITDNYSH